MPRSIIILPESIASKIAAGEVVQRPASAVKELIENSIDAGAKNISIIIKEAGKKLIQVVDDGCGMSPEDATVAFRRHATSKISTLEDLENIQTLGFRGEALAAIAAISQVELKSRRMSDEVGTKVRIDGGLMLEIVEDSAAVGTSIVVKNLFYNTPARRKFLKSDNTEFRHIFDVIQRVALAYPELSLTFISDDETMLKLRPSSSAERVKEIFGEKLSQALFNFTEESEFATISGFLGKPDFARKGKTEQYLFLNRRPIINRSIYHAIFQGYENLLEKGSFPLFIVFLTIDPYRVDVNVHPSKMEVKFDDEQSIYRFVLSSVRRALSAKNLIPVMEMREEKNFKEKSDTKQRTVRWEELLYRQQPTTEVIAGNKIPAQTLHPHDVTNIDKVVSPKPETFSVPLWQIHNKYIIVPIDEGIMIVDQHAAHERILYERTISRLQTKNRQSQQLLFPHTLEMTVGNVTLVKQLMPLLEELGFSIKIFGKTTVIIDGVPVDVKPGDEKTILQDVIDLFREDEHKIKLEPRERLAKSYSCKAAIKAGDSMNEEEMRTLLAQLYATEIPYVCPHGRPVMIKLSLSDLDKRFGRTP